MWWIKCDRWIGTAESILREQDRAFCFLWLWYLLPKSIFNSIFIFIFNFITTSCKIYSNKQRTTLTINIYFSVTVMLYYTILLLFYYSSGFSRRDWSLYDLIHKAVSWIERCMLAAMSKQFTQAHNTISLSCGYDRDAHYSKALYVVILAMMTQLAPHIQIAQ